VKLARGILFMIAKADHVVQQQAKTVEGTASSCTLMGAPVMPATSSVSSVLTHKHLLAPNFIEAISS
jgi:hypothetical protein